MRTLAVTTPCTRPANLHAIHRSIFSVDGARHFAIEWHVVFDAGVLCALPLTVVEAFAEDARVCLSFNRCGPELPAGATRTSTRCCTTDAAGASGTK